VIALIGKLAVYVFISIFLFPEATSLGRLSGHFIDGQIWAAQLLYYLSEVVLLRWCNVATSLNFPLVLVAPWLHGVVARAQFRIRPFVSEMGVNVRVDFMQPL
jgi:hypothetical protein